MLCEPNSKTLPGDRKNCEAERCFVIRTSLIRTGYACVTDRTTGVRLPSKCVSFPSSRRGCGALHEALQIQSSGLCFSNRVEGNRRDVLTCPLFGTVSSALFGTLHEGVTSVGSSRQRSQGGLVHLVNGCRGDAEFRGDRVDRVLGDVEVYPTVGGEVWADVALVVSLNFITV